MKSEGYIADTHLHLEASERIRLAERSAPPGGLQLDPEAQASLFTECMRGCISSLQRARACAAQIRFNPLTWRKRGVSFELQLERLGTLKRESPEVDWNVFVTVKRGQTAEKWDAALEFLHLGKGSCVDGLDVSRSYQVTDEAAGRNSGSELPSNAPLVARSVRDLGGVVAFHSGWHDTAADVWSAIEILGATRLGHGVAMGTDTALMNRVRNDEILIEICPSAAIHVGKICLAEHPGRTWLANGLRLSLGSDHPVELGTDISREWELLHTTWPELREGALLDGTA